MPTICVSVNPLRGLIFYGCLAFFFFLCEVSVSFPKGVCNSRSFLSLVGVSSTLDPLNSGTERIGWRYIYIWSAIEFFLNLIFHYMLHIKVVLKKGRSFFLSLIKWSLVPFEEFCSCWSILKLIFCIFIYLLFVVEVCIADAIYII